MAGLYVALALVVVLIAAVVVFRGALSGSGDPQRKPVSVAVTPTPTPIISAPTDAVQTQVNAGPTLSIEQMLADSDSQVAGLSADQMAQVTDLSINNSLPDTWFNVLLLGTDERTLNDSARTDSMMICSINRSTGQVKLTSIMRDIAIEYTDIGEYNGTYRINAANFFGGPNLAMKTVNEKFGMNIQNYVMVNFFGFQKIAQKLGGVEMDITQEEMDEINKLIVKQAKMAFNAGIDESDQENVYLENYGENTHLNGRQTLAYARIRKLNGGDYMRSERQRRVLGKLMEKVKDLDAMEIASLVATMGDQVKTNLSVEDIISTAILVGNGVTELDTFQLPVSGTYVEETRDGQAMLWDCDFTSNATQLYNFIYE